MLLAVLCIAFLRKETGGLQTKEPPEAPDPAAVLRAAAGDRPRPNRLRDLLAPKSQKTRAAISLENL